MLCVLGKPYGLPFSLYSFIILVLDNTTTIHKLAAINTHEDKLQTYKR